MIRSVALVALMVISVCGRASDLVQWGDYSFEEVTSVASLPEPIRTDLLAGGPIAERGAERNSGDVIHRGGPPSRRFVTAGRDSAKGLWVVAVESGAFSYHLNLLLYEIDSVRNAWSVSQCAGRSLSQVISCFRSPRHAQD